MSENAYYTYCLSHPETRLPYYVGVARVTKNCPLGFRPKIHIREANSYLRGRPTQKGANLHKIRATAKIIEDGHLPAITIDQTGMSRDEAYAREMLLIQFWGRRDQSSGCLTNLTDGGEGCTNLSAEGRARLVELRKSTPAPSKGMKLGPYSPERIEAARQGLIAHHSDPNVRKANSDRQKGKILSDDHKSKIASSLKGRPSPMRGRIPANKGKKTGPMSDEARANMKGRTPWNKGVSLNTKGKTYEEIYDPEKARLMREMRTKKIVQD